jgi:hypothetical protein
VGVGTAISMASGRAVVKTPAMPQVEPVMDEFAGNLVRLRDDAAQAFQLPPDKVCVRRRQKSRGAVVITATA